MGVRDQVRQLYSLGFSTIADMLTEAVLVRKGEASYDPSTGEVLQPEEGTIVRGLLRGIRKTDAGGNILATDRVLVTRCSELGSFIPNPETDYVVVGEERFEIIPPLREDPARDIIAVQLRRME